MLRKCFLSKVVLLAVLLVLAFSLNGQSVSPSGAFTYEYPIEIPKGTNGMQPSISLAYNSQAGNGIAGMGWSLTGFPAITRDTSYPIHWNDTDHFVYNGQRLIRDSQNTLLYHTEAESFQKIEYINNDHWVVSLKNGTKMYFGATTDSKIEAIGKNAPLLWSLNKVIDVNGNYYTVTYEEDTANGDYYPKLVKYTQNDNPLISNYKEILFDYDLTRKDKYITYNPSQMEMNQRLKTITVNIDNILHKKYELVYENPTNLGDRSKISFIQEYGSDGLPIDTVLAFDWNYINDGIDFSAYNLDGFGVISAEAKTTEALDRIKSADLNGDGKSDLYQPYSTPTGLRIHLWISNNSNSFDYDFYDLDGFGVISAEAKTTEALGRINVADLNGDGKSDLYQPYSTSTGLRIHRWISIDGRNFNYDFYDLDGFGVISAEAKTTEALDRIKPADLNGDGKSDLYQPYSTSTGLRIHLWISNNSNSFDYDFYDLDGFGVIDTEAKTTKALGRINVADLNGDGKSDLYQAHSRSTGLRIHRWISIDGRNFNYDFYDLDGFGVISAEAKTTEALDRIKPADLNGDGKSDLYQPYSTSTGLRIHLWISNNSNSFDYDFYDLDGFGLIDAEAKTTEALARINVADLNGDGKSDLYQAHSRSTGLRIHRWMSIDGRNFNYDFYDLDGFGVISAEAKTTEALDRIKPVDLNGDGVSDLYQPYSTPTGLRIHKWIGLYSSENITKITLPSGATIKPTYAPAPQEAGAVNPADSVYPNVTNKSPRSVVTSLTVSEGHDTSKAYTSTYEYFNGKYRSGVREDRKQLGFEWTIKRNPDGSYIKTYFHQDDDHAVGTSGVLAGLIKRVEVYGKDGLLYSAKEVEYGATPILQNATGYKPINFVHKTAEYGYSFNGIDTTNTTWDQLKNLSGLEVLKTRVSYTYDDNGNLIKVVNDGDTSTIMDDTVTDTLYTSGDIVVPYSVKQYRYPLDATSTTPIELASHTELFFDNNASLGAVGFKGQVTKKIEYSGEVDQLNYPNVETSYSYDGFGNLKTITNGYGGVTTYNYDSIFNSYFKSEVNALGDTVVEYGYDALGRVEWVKDINDVYLYYSYDNRNRVIEVAKGYNFATKVTLTTTEYNDVSTSIHNPRWIRESVFSPSEGDAGNYIESVTYFDNLGNILQTKSHGNDSTFEPWATTNYYNNPETGITKVSEPYYEVSSSYAKVDDAQWDNTVMRHMVEYRDAIGRPYKTVAPDGFTEMIKYGVRDKYSLSHDKNGLGSLIYEEAVDNKLVTYSYEKGNYLYSSLVDNTFNNSTWSYKTILENGKDLTRLSEIAKDSGFIEGSTNVITTRSDFFGRKKSYSDPDMGTWRYTYDANGNLKSQTDANDYTTTFEYDQLNRITKKIGAKTTIYLYDGKTVSGGIDPVKYGPDSLGQLTEVYYEDGSYSESYYYDNTNKIYKITKTIDGYSRTIETTVDDLGRIIGEKLPTSENIAYHYRDDGQLSSVKRAGLSYINNLDYTILGKIKSFESGNSVKTIYTYNENHQLSGLNIKNFNADIIAEMTFDYDTFGNIIKKTFVDDFYSFHEDFTYDGFSRLISATTNNTLYADKHYEYDNYNNMLSKNGLTYKYNQIDGKPHAVSEIEDGLSNIVKTYKYDNNGNIVKITGQSHLVVRAKAADLSNPPVMELWLDGELKKTWVVSTTSYKDFSWDGVVPQGATIDILLNDKSLSNTNPMAPMSGLVVDFININGSIVHSESVDTVFDAGNTANECFDNLNVSQGQELITVMGALRYVIPLAAQSPVRDLYYNADNRLVSIYDNSVLTSFFRYDDTGQRIVKKEGDITTYYFFDSYHEEWKDENSVKVKQKSTSYYFANGQRVAYRETDETVSPSVSKVYYYHTDHLGSAVRITDEDGSVIQSIDYTPYGEVARFSGEDSTKYTFTGQESDGSGFMYYNARYYDPELGRFLQSDTYLDGMNRYAYCSNNPVMYVDPTGHDYYPGEPHRQKTDESTNESSDNNKESSENDNNPNPEGTGSGSTGNKPTDTKPEDTKPTDVTSPSVSNESGGHNSASVIAPLALTTNSIVNGVVNAAIGFALPEVSALLFIFNQYEYMNTVSMDIEQKSNDPSYVFNLLSDGSGIFNKIEDVWHPGTFDSSEDSLHYHFKKHGPETKSKTLEKYICKAKQMAKNTRRAKKQILSGETNGIRYIKNGNYIDIATDGRIISYGTR